MVLVISFFMLLIVGVMIGMLSVLILRRMFGIFFYLDVKIKLVYNWFMISLVGDENGFFRCRLDSFGNSLFELMIDCLYM